MWSLASKTDHQIDIFNRRLLRRVIGIYWPNNIQLLCKSYNYYIITLTTIYKNHAIKSKGSLGASKSNVEGKNQMVGHAPILRMEPGTPAQQAFAEALMYCKKKFDKPPLTWLKKIRKIKNH